MYHKPWLLSLKFATKASESAPNVSGLIATTLTVSVLAEN